MSRKEKFTWFVVFLPILVFAVWVIHCSFNQNYAIEIEEVYEPFPFFDELYSFFWSGYLKFFIG